MKNKNTSCASQPSEPANSRSSPMFSRRTIIAALLGCLVGCLVGFAFSSFVLGAQHESSLHEFILRYFASWSGNDMKGYADCFDPSATVYLAGGGRAVTRENLDEFLAGQIEAHKAAVAPLQEHPTDIEMVVTGDTAYVRVLWKLTAGNRTAVGYDHFIVRKTPAGWKIVSLLFYDI